MKESNQYMSKSQKKNRLYIKTNRKVKKEKKHERKECKAFFFSSSFAQQREVTEETKPLLKCEENEKHREYKTGRKLRKKSQTSERFEATIISKNLFCH